MSGGKSNNIAATFGQGQSDLTWTSDATSSPAGLWVVLAERRKNSSSGSSDVFPQERERTLSEKKQTTRAKGVKVRTGCQNCKLRRVKCDEGLPGCNRCFRYGVYCSGYAAVKKPRPPLPVIRALAPKRTPGVFISKMHDGGPRFADEMESRYFRYYCEEIAAQITGPFKTSLWDRLIPQVSDVEPFVGHAIVALGALSKSRKVSHHLPLELCSHRQYALQKYSEALKGMRNALHGKTPDTRKALLACLLVFCFESLQGNQAAASLHASSGVALFRHWNTQGRCHDSRSSNGAVIEDDDIYQAIAALDFQALCFLDQRPSYVHDALKAELNHYISLMPSVLDKAGQFVTLRESRHYGLLMMRRTFHFIYSTKIYIKNTRRVDLQNWEEEDNAHLSLGNNVWSAGPSRTPVFPQDMKGEYEEYVADVQRWEDASSAILTDIAKDPDNEDFVAAAMMKIHARMTLVTLAGTFFPEPISYDALIPQFESIVTLASSIHKRLLSDIGAYNFEIGVLPALLFIGLHCRHRRIRSRAIELMHECGTMGYREGICDAGAVARMSEWARDIEEAWADETGFVPAEKRITLLGINIVLHERRAQIICSRSTGPGEADWEYVQKYIKW